MARVRIVTDREGRRELPFTLGVLAPLGGENPAPIRWRTVDRDTFDDLFQEIAPTLTLPQGSFTFRSLDDFEPEALARQVAAEDTAPLGADVLLDALRTPSMRPTPENPLAAFIDKALEGTTIHRGTEPAPHLPGASLVAQAMHEPAFRTLEAAWRGLYHLVRQTDTDATLKIRVCDVRREGLLPAVQALRGPTPEPIGLLLADFAFGQTDEDVLILYPLVKELAASGTVLLAAESPKQVMEQAPGEAWSVFRKLDSARHLALVGPRLLGRLPFSRETFTEVTDPAEARQYLWLHAVWQVGAALAVQYAQTGWFAHLHGLRLTNLPTPIYHDAEGDAVMRPPVEESLDDKAMYRRSEAGLISVIHERGSDRAVVPIVRSVQEPRIFDEPELTAAAEVLARLPFVLASSRFVHAARESGASAAEVNAWLADYVSAFGPLLDASANECDGRLELYLQPWLGREELPGAVRVPVDLPPE
jgi:hypothetical protein